MDFQAILVSNGLAIAIILLILFNLPAMNLKTGSGDMFFLSVCFSTLIGAGIGITQAIIDGTPGAFVHVFMLFINSLIILVSVYIGYAFFAKVITVYYSSTRKIRRTLITWSWMIWGVLICLIVNLFYPFIFEITAENIFVARQLALIGFIPDIIYLAYALFLVNRIKKKRMGFIFFSSLGFVIAPIAAIVIRILYYQANVIWLSIAIATAAFYIGTQTDMEFEDSKTGLYNRNFLDFTLGETKKAGKSLLGMMVSITNIGDLINIYGSQVRDETVMEAAVVLSDIIDRNTAVIRYSGENFLLIKPGNENELDDFCGIMEASKGLFKSNPKRDYDIDYSVGAKVLLPEDSVDEWIKTMEKQLTSRSK